MKYSPEDNILSNKSKKNKTDGENKPYFDNTHQIFTPSWINYKNPSLHEGENEVDEDSDGEKRPKGKALLKKIYGGGKPDIIKEATKNYTKVINHLNEHQAEGVGDPKDVKQSKELQQDLQQIEDLNVRATKIPKRDHLYKVSNPREVQKRAIEIYGKDAIVYKSNKPAKKYQILNPVSGKWIYFGDAKMEDFTKHKDADRRRRYLARALKIKGNWRDDIYSPNYLAILLLW